MRAGMSNISGAGAKISNNTNDTSRGQSGRVDKANKDGLGGTNSYGVDRTDIEVGVKLSGTNKSSISKANKDDMGGAD